MDTYRTADVARIIGIHVNTVRLYEKCGLIPKPERKENGYRVFTDLHLEQFRLARAALQVEVLQNGLRKQAVRIVKVAAAGDYCRAAELTRQYLAQVDRETEHAEEAIRITKEILSEKKLSGADFFGDIFPGAGKSCRDTKKNCRNPEKACRRPKKTYTRKEAAGILQVTIDTLRNWELNGLFTAKRRENGYRIYTEEDMQRLKIIRSLRCANYSLSAILRMLHGLSADPEADIRQVIDTPGEDDDIITACDKLLTSLGEARRNACYVAAQIEKMKSTFNHQTSGLC